MKTLEISVNDSPKDLSKRGTDGVLDEEANLATGDTTFRQVLKEHLSHLRKVTKKHLQSCCCEICLTMMKMHAELLRWREKTKEMRSNLESQTKKALIKTTPQSGNLDDISWKKSDFESYLQFCFKNNGNRHEKASDALCEMMCPKVEVNGKEFFKWSCVLGKMQKLSSTEMTLGREEHEQGGQHFL